MTQNKSARVSQISKEIEDNGEVSYSTDYGIEEITMMTDKGERKIEGIMISPQMAIIHFTSHWSLTHVATGHLMFRSSDVFSLEKVAWDIMDIPNALDFTDPKYMPPQFIEYLIKLRSLGAKQFEFEYPSALERD